MSKKKSPDLFLNNNSDEAEYEGAPGQKISLSGILPGQIIRPMIETVIFRCV